MWHFPNLDGPTVFIAAPGDLEYMHNAAIAEIEYCKAESIDGDRLSLYDWSIDKSKNGFEDWIPAQGQIPLPNDPNCRAVICMFGERIGKPLPEDFPLDVIESHLGRVSSRGYRLCIPWCPGAESDGGFALTGSVFEFLATFVQHENSDKHAPPILILFIGDESICDDTNLLDANWGGGRLLEQAHKRFRRSELREWERTQYLPQVAQLRNFFAYLSDLGLLPRIVADEKDARKEIREFILRSLNLRLRKTADKPFKGLEPYGIADLDVFFGRDFERRAALMHIEHAFNDQSTLNSLCILGSSGAGKSSFLRAGLIAYLSASKLASDYLGFVLSPQDLCVNEPDHTARSSGRLSALVRAALQHLNPEVNPVDFDKTMNETKAEHQPEVAISMIEVALSKITDEHRLLIGIDQFEELIDDWLSEESKEDWRVVVRFLHLATQHPRIFFIFTLQHNRATAMSNDPIFGEIMARGRSLLLAFPLQSLKDIIEGPFEVAGQKLMPEVAQALQGKIVTFIEKADSDSQSSLLPLISLAMHGLYSRCIKEGLEIDLKTLDKHLNF